MPKKERAAKMAAMAIERELDSEMVRPRASNPSARRRTRGKENVAKFGLGG